MFTRTVSTTKNYAASEYLGLANVLWTAGLYGGADYFVLPPSGVQTLDLNPYAPTGIHLDANGLTHLIGGVSPNFVHAETLYSAAGTALPACNAGSQGDQRVVSDATAPAYMAAYTSGGSVTAAVICGYNGTSYGWLTH
jgi:hypothetical protein